MQVIFFCVPLHRQTKCCCKKSSKSIILFTI
nr:MAG TPA: hypothetical protein [Caudoviricetes sp.]